MPHAVDRHAHWSFLNFDEAIKGDLVAPDGSKVVAKLDAIGHWFVAYGNPACVQVTDSWITTASLLNHFGVLPRAQHEDWLRSQQPDETQETCPCCGRHIEPDVIHRGDAL